MMVTAMHIVVRGRSLEEVVSVSFIASQSKGLLTQLLDEMISYFAYLVGAEVELQANLPYFSCNVKMSLGILGHGKRERMGSWSSAGESNIVRLVSGLRFGRQ